MKLSSAEDVTSSPVTPRTESSDSAPEEFRVEPHSGESGDQRSSDSPPQDNPPVQLVDSASPEEPELPSEHETADELKRKPLPKVTALAREVRVRATSARPGTVLGERELFTESTTTVLIFEKGAVLRLAAAVAPGQLLYLANEETSRELVAQVVRKRAFRPTECYVEVDFSEPAPEFWGVTFSAATALLPKDEKEAAAAEMVASSDTTTDELADVVPAPSPEEVLALKKEIDALRKQLGMVRAPASPPPSEPEATIPEAPSAPSVAPARPLDVPTATDWPALRASIPSEPSPTAGPEPIPLAAAVEQEIPRDPALDFHISIPKMKRSFRARGQFTPGFRVGLLRLSLLTATLVVLVGVAWYKQWMPWMHGPQKIAVSSLAGGVTSAAPVTAARTPNPADVATQTSDVAAGKDAGTLASPSTKPQSATSKTETPTESPLENITVKETSPPPDIATSPAPRKKSGLGSSVAKRSTAPAAKPLEVAPNPVQPSGFVPPKLLRAGRAVASLDDLRDFETGSVIIDAVVSISGDVTSMNVLSGPPSLRRPATQALKNYKYEPATLNGQPVPAHVTVKIQFRFE